MKVLEDYIDYFIISSLFSKEGRNKGATAQRYKGKQVNGEIGKRKVDSMSSRRIAGSFGEIKHLALAKAIRKQGSNTMTDTFFPVPLLRCSFFPLYLSLYLHNIYFFFLKHLFDFFICIVYEFLKVFFVGFYFIF